VRWMQLEKQLDTDGIVLVFDGFMLPKGRLQEACLPDMQRWIAAETGYDVEWAIKPMEEGVSVV